MALNQNLKAVITFGGNLDASWNRSTQGINKGIKDVEKQTQKLTKQQQSLSAEIKKAKLAGKDISALKRDYTGVTKEIKKASAAQEALNRDLKRAEQFKRVQGLGKGAFAKAGNIAASMFPGGLALGGGGLIAGALGSLIAPAARNAQTAEKVGIAKSYGVGVETFNAWDSLGKQYGMNGENFGDLFEEYLHKAGEYKQNGKQGGLQDAFETLGFKAGDLAGLSDLEQFSKIVERALTLKDQSKASFALDSLFGGEASKMLMLIKQSGKSYRDLMDEQKRYQLVTEEGARGAMEGNRAVTNLQTVLSSAMDEISGQLGGELSPQIKDLTNNLAEWFKNGGISKIVSFMKNELYPSVLTFGNGVVLVGKIIYALAKKASFLLPDEQDDKRKVMRSLAMTGSTEIARGTAEGLGLGEWFDDSLKKNPALVKQVQKAYTSTQGLIFSDDDAFNQQIDSIANIKPAQGMLSWDEALFKERTPLVPLAAPQDVSPSSVPTFPDDKRAKEDALPRRDSELPDMDAWPTLMQQIDRVDIERKPTSITDSRRQELKVEINVSSEQEGTAIADEVINKAQATDIFNGNNAMYDNGGLW
ncbi:hypothetical protein [Hafnia paralvei]|uniref:hypothetical protein n=1 Tax=Hafnia paralvei TaxID=546367 RepID=UPI001F414475|nr:hypothetical protein [Hafnia paralvei]MCE9902506.1 hypothetical protein [Hafnia paralvei]MCE9921779.1 hypothetical protein [Hafnia paralvei]